MTNFFTQHTTVDAIVGYYLFSSLVGGMPDPTPTSSMAYQWLFKTLHLLAGNVTAAFQAKINALQTQGGTVTQTQTTQTTTAVTPPPNPPMGPVH